MLYNSKLADLTAIPETGDDSSNSAISMFANIMSQGKAHDAQVAAETAKLGKSYGDAMATTMANTNKSLSLATPDSLGAAPAQAQVSSMINPDPNFNPYTPVAPPQNPTLGMTYARPVISAYPDPYSYLSDETQKTEIKDDPKLIQEFLDAMGDPKSYQYRDTSLAGAGEGTFISPMAQELEKAQLSKEYVHTDDDGNKRVDYGRMQGLILSALAHLNKKVNKGK